MTTVDRGRLARRLELEQQRFIDTHPQSHALFQRAKKSLLAGVPMSWMVKWAGSFPVFVTSGDLDRFQHVLQLLVNVETPGHHAQWSVDQTTLMEFTSREER